MAPVNRSKTRPPYRETRGRFVRRLILLTPWEEATPRLSKEQETALWRASHNGWLTKKVRDRISKLKAVEKTRSDALRKLADTLPLNLAGIRTQERKPGFNTRLLFVRPRDIEVIDPVLVLVHMTHYPELIAVVIRSVVVDLIGEVRKDPSVVDRLLGIVQSGMPQLSIADRDLLGRCLKVSIDQAKYRQLVRSGTMEPFDEGVIQLRRGTTKILPEVF